MIANHLMAGLAPVHPGAVLREDVLPALTCTKAQLAGYLGISRQNLYSILQERQPVTPRVAVRLGKVLGNGGAVWARMQQAYDLAAAERDLAADLERIPTLVAA